ncbi:hypothetical protein F5884DRAFT_824054 [Xylogone sp. PMI_703]|nr:hypothetical protein F5884DRAFT_824054 [Xylogone sp. PMI_703]
MSNSTTAAHAAAEAAFHRSTIESWTLYSIAFASTILRTYARIWALGATNLQATDYLVWAGTLFHTAQTTLAYSIGNVAHGLANNGMTAAQRVELSPGDTEFGFRVVGSKIQVAGWTTYSALMWSLKLSILAFYIQLTDGLGGRYRIRIYIGFGLVISTFLACIFTIMLACRPFNHYWQVNPDPGNACQAAISKPIIWVSFATNISTDIYLIMIPLPVLWNSRLRLAKKIASSIILSTGVFVLICALLKSIFILVVVSIRSSSSNKTYRSSTGFRTIGGGGGNSSHQNRQRPLSTNSMPVYLTTLGESNETIVDDSDTQGLKSTAALASQSHQPQGITVVSEVDVTHEDRTLRGIKWPGWA